jgi:diacylglycerol kinase (ATP)
MPKPGHRGLQRIVATTIFALRGLRSAWRNEAAFRHECIATIALLPAAFALGETLTQTALLIGVCLVVLVTELLNSALEAALDRIGEEHHPLTERAKDMSCAAVAVSMVLAGLVWGLVTLERLLDRLLA